MKPETARAAQDRILQAGRVVVVTHVAPDGDAFGSLFGMGQILGHMGKSDVTLACDDPVPEAYHFLALSGQVVNRLEPVSPADPFDLIITVDCSDAARGGQTLKHAWMESTPLVNIDHHVTNTCFGVENLVDAEAAATTEVLYRLALSWDIAITAPLALALLTGLVTDTLCFRTANVTPTVMRTAIELMQAGADLTLITSQTVNRKPFEEIRYWGQLLSTARLDGRVASVHASAADRRDGGYGVEGDASIVAFLNTAWEADIAASFVEKDNGEVEISLRAKPGYDVSRVALNLGGGGHAAAAGCTLGGPLEPVMDRVLQMLQATQERSTGNPPGQGPAGCGGGL